MMNYSDKVLEFATKWHEGQFRKYGSGLPYITHPIAVQKIAIRIAPEWGVVSPNDLDLISSIAYGHDLDEDTNVSEDDWDGLYIDIKRAGYFIEYYEWKLIRNAIQALTKKPNYDLFEYLTTIKQNRFALIVKLADLEHNMSDLKDRKKLDYYRLIKYYLEH
jgi:(p)ppGpp synthase/HD superfamily hydrolase